MLWQSKSAQETTLARLCAFANLPADQDTRVAAYQGMGDEMTQVAATPALKPHAFALRDVPRRKAKEAPYFSANLTAIVTLTGARWPSTSPGWNVDARSAATAASAIDGIGELKTLVDSTRPDRSTVISAWTTPSTPARRASSG